MSQGEIQIGIGSGRLACTTKLTYYTVTLRHVGRKVIFIDTMGLDDSGDIADKMSEDNLGKMHHLLKNEKNIVMVILV